MSLTNLFKRKKNKEESPFKEIVLKGPGCGLVFNGRLIAETWMQAFSKADVDYGIWIYETEAGNYVIRTKSISLPTGKSNVVKNEQELFEIIKELQKPPQSFYSDQGDYSDKVLARQLYSHGLKSFEEFFKPTYVE